MPGPAFVNIAGPFTTFVIVSVSFAFERVTRVFDARVTGALTVWLPEVTVTFAAFEKLSRVNEPPAPGAMVYAFALLKVSVPTLRALSSVIVVGAVVTLPRLAVSPALLGAIAGDQFPLVAHEPPAATFHVETCAAVPLIVRVTKWFTGSSAKVYVSPPTPPLSTESELIVAPPLN